MCFEMRRLGRDEPPLIIDLGSAASNLGSDLVARAEALRMPVRAEVLIGHLHLDHVIGLPFFSPLYIPGSRIRLHCGIVKSADALLEVLSTFAAPPFFPVHPMDMDTLRFAHFEPESRFRLVGFDVTATRMNHPGGCCGFRIESPHGTVCIVGDHEHGEPAADARVAALTRDADVMLYDGAYDDREYPRFQGWGHSTWQAGLDLAAASGVGRTLIYHHQPEHSDRKLRELDALVASQAPSARLARQNMRVLLRDGRSEILGPDDPIPGDIPARG